jgi:hypothetical protein
MMPPQGEESETAIGSSGPLSILLFVRVHAASNQILRIRSTLSALTAGTCCATE